jgi:hypothetical protein
MAIMFADSFVELLYRVKFSLLSGATGRTFRRDQVGAWINARLRKAAERAAA